MILVWSKHTKLSITGGRSLVTEAVVSAIFRAGQNDSGRILESELIISCNDLSLVVRDEYFLNGNLSFDTIFPPRLVGISGLLVLVEMTILCGRIQPTALTEMQ